MKNRFKFDFYFLFIILFCGIFVIITISQFTVQYSLQDENNEIDDEGNGSNDEGHELFKVLGLIAIILFGIVLIKPLLFFINKFTRKLPESNDFYLNLKKNTKVLFLKTRKILQYSHYIAGTIAIVLLYIHTVYFFGENVVRTINGIITAIILTFYVITGMISKFKNKSFWNSEKFKKWSMKIHRSFLLYIFIIIFHLIHLFLED
ncbi:hypothetical protein [Candidatus Harpocratesius sp.]